MISLPISPPRPSGAYARPLLALSSHVTNQAAGTAIRSWWHRLPEKMRAHDGIVLERADILHRNNENGAGPMPIREFSGVDAKRRPVLLILFADQSACVLRGVQSHADDAAARAAAQDRRTGFRLLPAVLRLSSIARPAEGHPLAVGEWGGLKIKMRGRKSPLVALERGTGGTGWVNLEASWTCDIDGITYEHRQRLLSDLVDEAVDWSACLDDLPPMALPRPGQPHPFQADEEQARALGIGVGASFVLPAAIPWCGFTAKDRARIEEFAKQVARWMQIRTRNLCRSIDVEIGTVQPSQKARKAVPHVRVICTRTDGDKAAEARMNTLLTPMLDSILRSEIFPAPLASLVGQTECDWRDRRTWLEPARIAHVFAPPQDQISNHEKLSLHATFDRFWPDA